MSEPSGPVNGQNRVVEGLVTTGGAAGYRKGTNPEAVAGSAYNALDQVVTLGTTPIVGALTETAPATDTASSGLNGRLQRIAQRLTSLIALLPAALGAGGGLKVDGSGTALDVNLSTALSSAVDSVVVIGDVAHDAAATTSAPVKIGGKATAAEPAPVADGDVVQAWYGLKGAAMVGGKTATAGDGYLSATWPGNAAGTTLSPWPTASFLSNGTSWDRQRGNVEATLLASAERTATTSSTDQINYNGRGCIVVFDFTVETDAGVSIVVTIEGKDALSGKYYTILTSAAFVAVGTTVLTVFPGAVAVANLVANALLPRVWRVTCTPADTKRATYSVGSVTIV